MKITFRNQNKNFIQTEKQLQQFLFLKKKFQKVSSPMFLIETTFKGRQNMII